MDNRVEKWYMDFLAAVFFLMFTSLGSVKCGAVCMICGPVSTQHGTILL